MWNSTSIMACACRLSIHRLQRGCNPLKRTLFTAAASPRLVKFNTVEPTSSPTLSEMRQFFKSNGCQVSTGYTCLKLACPYCVEQKEVADKGARSKEKQLYVNMTTGRIFKEKIVCVLQCCVTRVGTWTRVHSSLLGLGLESSFFHFDSDSDSDSEIVTHDSGPSHARVQAVAAVPCCIVYSDIRYILLFVFMFWKINKCWICGLLDLWLGLEIFFWLGLGLGLRLRLWGDDSDSDSDLTTWTRTQHWCFEGEFINFISSDVNKESCIFEE